MLRSMRHIARSHLIYLCALNICAHIAAAACVSSAAAARHEKGCGRGEDIDVQRMNLSDQNYIA